MAVIGSGPSGFYAAEHLQEQEHLEVQIDMYDRLPTPFGLVRGGVAPDHQKIKSVTRVYDKIAAHPEFRFYGNVEMGRDLTHADLSAYYHAIIYAVGARTDRRMGIPREHLPGSHSATEFVGWYNAHPDFRSLGFDLSSESAAVVGNGNVAMDLARILASPREVLAATDIAEHALHELEGNGIREIHVLGRRGPAQAAFTNKELKELGELPGVDVIVDPAAVELDPLSAADVAARPNRTRDRNLELLREFSERPLDRGAQADRPALPGLAGRDHRHRARRGPHDRPQRALRERGRLDPPPPDRAPHHPADRPGLPGDRLPGRAAAGHPLRRHARGDPERRRAHHRPAHRRAGAGRVRGRMDQARAPGDHRDQQARLPGDGRQPPGRPRPGPPPQVEVPSREVLERLLRERRSDFVSYEDWQLIDLLEQERGDASGAPRVKFSKVEEMLHALQERKRRRRRGGRPTEA